MNLFLLFGGKWKGEKVQWFEIEIRESIKYDMIFLKYKLGFVISPFSLTTYQSEIIKRKIFLTKIQSRRQELEVIRIYILSFYL